MPNDPLFPFQREDVDYLADQNSALIANDMGTGKTFEAIARDLEMRDGQPGATLVIAPLQAVYDVWLPHYRELTSLKVVAVDPKQRDKTWAYWCAIAGDVYLVTGRH